MSTLEIVSDTQVRKSTSAHRCNVAHDGVERFRVAALMAAVAPRIRVFREEYQRRVVRFARCQVENKRKRW